MAKSPSALETWAQALSDTLAGLRQAVARLQALAAVPDDGQPDERLPVLAGVLGDLGLEPDADSRAVRLRAGELARSLTAALSDHTLQAALRAMLTGIQAAHVEARQLGGDLDSIASSSLDPAAVVFVREWPGSRQLLVAVRVEALPEGDRLRDALPVEELFRDPDGRPVLVLGGIAERQRGSDPRPRPVYSLADARVLTRGMRQAQRFREQREQADRRSSRGPRSRDVRLQETERRVRDLEDRLQEAGAGA